MLGFIAYGIYIYLQDQSSDNERGISKNHDASIQSLSTETDVDVIDNGRDVEDLSKLTAQTLKSNTIVHQNPVLEDSATFTSVNHNAERQTVDIGMTFSLEDLKHQPHNCTITIRDSESQLITATAPVIAQQLTTGCKFKQLDLNSLGDLNVMNRTAWEVTVTVQALNNQELLKLTKRISSLESLITIGNKL